jgi:hypothetical protein
MFCDNTFVILTVFFIKPVNEVGKLYFIFIIKSDLVKCILKLANTAWLCTFMEGLSVYQQQLRVLRLTS